MKRHGHLFEQLVSWPNLLRAAWQATRGKRHRENVLQFQFDYESELLRLEQELKDPLSLVVPQPLPVPEPLLPYPTPWFSCRVWCCAGGFVEESSMMRTV